MRKGYCKKAAVALAMVPKYVTALQTHAKLSKTFSHVVRARNTAVVHTVGSGQSRHGIQLFSHTLNRLLENVVRNGRKCRKRVEMNATGPAPLN